MKNWFKKISKNITDDGYRFRLLLIVTSIIIGLTLIVSLIINIVNNLGVIIIYSSLMLFICVATIVSSCVYKKTRLIGLVFSITITILLLMIAINGGKDSYAVLWFLLLPGHSIILHGAKRGSIFSVIVFFLLLVVVYTPLKVILNYNPELFFMQRFFIAYVCGYLLSLSFEITRMITSNKLKIALDKYKYHAKYDALTNVENRYSFNRTIIKCLNNNINKTPMSLLIIDIDNFKDCNDAAGHLFGDYILREVAIKMKAALSKDDLICRWGGEEFAVLLQGATEEETNQKAEVLRKQVEELEFKDKKREKCCKLTISIGYVHFLPTEKTKPEQLEEIADDYMYQAKRQGKNRVVGRSLEL